MTVRNPIQHLRLNHTLSLAIIIISFIVINLFLFLHYGIKIVADTERYMEYSNAIRDQGIHFEKHNFWYLGYVLFITFFRQLSNDPGVIIIAQVFISLFAPLAIYYASYTLTQHKHYALFPALLYIFWFKISQWNFYVHPESLYVSLTAITLSSVVVTLHKKSNYLLPCLLAALTFWIKPTGFVMGASFLVSLLYILNQKTKASGLFIAIQCLTLAVLLILLLNVMLATFTIVETYATGEIIYLYSPTGIARNFFIVESQHLISPTAFTPLGKMVDFIFHNFWFFCKITTLKGIVFLLHIKPYFSLLHNIAIILVLYPTYWLAGVGIKTTITPLQLFTTTYITLHCVIVMLTVEDWDGRFILPLLPVIFIFAAHGLHHLILTRRNQKIYDTA